MMKKISHTVILNPEGVKDPTRLRGRFFAALRMTATFLVCFSNFSCHSWHEENFSGTLELTEYSVGVLSAGRLVTLQVDEGAKVKQGEILGTLDRYDQAKKDYDRAVMLLKSGGSSDQAVERAKLDLEDETIFSPVDGVVLVKIREVGEVLPAGSPVVTIGDDRHLWVRVFIPEGLINRVQLNQPAVLRFDGLKKKFKGHVIFIAPKAEFTPRNIQTKEERVTQTFAVKMALDEPYPELHPGVNADVTLSF